MRGEITDRIVSGLETEPSGWLERDPDNANALMLVAGDDWQCRMELERLRAQQEPTRAIRKRFGPPQTPVNSVHTDNAALRYAFHNAAGTSDEEQSSLISR